MITPNSLLLPFPTRKAGIIEKIAYAENERLRLGAAIFDSYKPGGEGVRYVSQIAENILGCTRECFDHLGKDLIEGRLLPYSSQKFQRDYAAGRGKHYFPYYPTQLTNPKGSAFAEFKKINRPIFDELLAFVYAIEQKQCIYNTSHQVGQFRIIQEMVNDKKHSHVLEHKVGDKDKVFVYSKSGSYLFDADFRNDDPNMQIVLPEDRVTRRVGSYRFAHNGISVEHLCLFACHGTAMVMDIFYDKYFQATEKVHKLEPPPVVTSMPAPLSEILMPNPSKHFIVPED